MSEPRHLTACSPPSPECSTWSRLPNQPCQQPHKNNSNNNMKTSNGSSSNYSSKGKNRPTLSLETAELELGPPHPSKALNGHLRSSARCRVRSALVAHTHNTPAHPADTSASRRSIAADHTGSLLGNLPPAVAQSALHDELDQPRGSNAASLPASTAAWAAGATTRTALWWPPESVTTTNQQGETKTENSPWS